MSSEQLAGPPVNPQRWIARSSARLVRLAYMNAPPIVVQREYELLGRRLADWNPDVGTPAIEPWVDPVKEAQAAVIAVQSGFVSREQALATSARSDRWIECVAAIAGVTGALLLAMHGENAAWGWPALLASNAGWIAFAIMRRHWFLLLQQVGFTATSLLGIWSWLL